MGTELVRCGVKEVDSDPLWGAYANIHQPASVIQERLPFYVIWHDPCDSQNTEYSTTSNAYNSVDVNEQIRGLIQTQNLQTVCGDSNNTVAIQSAV